MPPPAGPRSHWAALAALAAAAALALALLDHAGIGGPRPLVVAAAAGLALLAALAALAAARLQGRALEAALTRAAAAERERGQLQGDVLRHDQLEQQLMQAKQAAEAAALAKGEFLATMSHEIRTPLNGIVPMLDLIARGGLAPDQREMLRTAHESSQQLLRIVDDILDYSKLEAQRLELEVTGFNLRELLEGVLLLMQRPAEDKGLRLDMEIDANVRLPVRGDPVRLRQVLTNLVGNAVKFTERGRIRVSVRRLGETHARHRLRFEVRDTGIGIGHEQQARLFLAFSQADASTTRLYGGTGLGLAICKRIVDLMDGRIGVQSEPGQGSTFWFEIPLLKAIGDQARPDPHDASRRVLVVSPDARLRQRLTLLLTNLGMEVSAVETVQQALERLRGPALPGQPAGYALAMADYDGLRRSAPALHRALARAHAGVRLLWLYGEESIPAEVQAGAGLLSRQATDADLRAAARPGIAAPAAPSPSQAAGPVPTTLPTLPAEADAAAPAATPASPDIGIVRADTAPRLLLVEDNPVNLRVVEMLLDVLGHACDTAANGQAALELMFRTDYDLVLMDCQMPVLDGYEATRRWRAYEEAAGSPGRRLPIVATTANAMAGDRQRCLDAGMDDYLSKPVTRDQLQACLQRWLAGPRAPHAQPAPEGGNVPVAESRAATASAPVATPAQAPAPVAVAVPDGAPNAATLDTGILDELRDVVGRQAESIVRLFLEDAPHLVRRAERAAAAADLEALREAAHALKSSSANVGAMALSEAAKRTELGARSRTLAHPAAAAAELAAELERARSALQAWLPAGDGPDQSSSLLSR